MVYVRLAVVVSLMVSAASIQPVIAQSSEKIPSLTGAQKISENPTGNGFHYYFQSSTSSASIVNGYKQPLLSAGWKIERSATGGSSWGSNGGLTATRGQSYLVLQAGGPHGQTFINLCVWPSKPDNDYC